MARCWTDLANNIGACEYRAPAAAEAKESTA